MKLYHPSVHTYPLSSPCYILSGQTTKQEADDVHRSPGETGQNIPYPVLNILFPGAGQCREHSGGHLRDIPQVELTIKIQ